MLSAALTSTTHPLISYRPPSPAANSPNSHCQINPTHDLSTANILRSTPPHIMYASPLRRPVENTKKYPDPPRNLQAPYFRPTKRYIAQYHQIMAPVQLSVQSVSVDSRPTYLRIIQMVLMRPHHERSVHRILMRPQHTTRTPVSV